MKKPRNRLYRRHRFPAAGRNRGKCPGGRGSQRLESVIQAMNDSAAA